MLVRVAIARTARTHSFPRLTSSVRWFETGKGSSLPQFPERKQSWLTRKVESSPLAFKTFKLVASSLGYGRPKSKAWLRSFAMYERVCAVQADVQQSFWKDKCDLPPTFQSWFTVTNLHIWILSVRLRALPPAYGKPFVENLLNHFFHDIEDRIRAIMQPKKLPSMPYTFTSTFYTNPNAPNKDTKRLSRAPDRIVAQQMKIFKEQWAGLGISMDHALVKGDMEMASAVWRNFLGARGASGIAFRDTQFKRAVNLVGGEVVNPEKIDLNKEETTDDGSGVHDYPPSDVDKYVRYPELMLEIVGFVRREISRLEALSDEAVIDGNLEDLMFGQPDKSQGSPQKRGKPKKLGQHHL